MSLVGKIAPLFNAPAVVNGNEIVEDFSLGQYLGKQEVVFFFYPKDFTFVCPTELLAFQAKIAEFEKRRVRIDHVFRCRSKRQVTCMRTGQCSRYWSSANRNVLQTYTHG